MLGVISAHKSITVTRTFCIQAFHSVPIDITHFLYANVGPNTVSFCFNTNSDLSDLTILRSSKGVYLIDSFLSNTSSSNASLFRPPRGLAQGQKWNPSEWKHFINDTSMLVLHDVIPKEFQKGWWSFSQCSSMVSGWYLREDDVRKIGKLVRKRHEHFSES